MNTISYNMKEQNLCEEILINDKYLYINLNFIFSSVFFEGAKGDWDFRISNLVKNPDGTDI